MKQFAFLFTLCTLATATQAQRFATREARIAFLSETPVEDIRAESNEASAILDLSNGQVALQVPILSFHFPKALMEEHFNENYMESDRFPKATFRGVVMGFDPGQSGAQPVTAQGTLEMHGVTKEREVSGTLEQTEGGWVLDAQFDVPCTDHNIDIPKVVTENIAEVIGVTLHAELMQK